MDINDIQRSNSLANAIAQNISKITGKVEDKGAFSGDDAVEFSAEAQEVSKLVNGEKSELLEFVKKNVPDVRESKVQDVKAKLSSGYYDTPEVIDDLVNKLSGIL